MKMNRRNVVIGLGTVVAGGGAALGSGAFSTAEASRELEVNVVTGTGIAEDFVDVILRGVDGHGSLVIGDADSPTSADTLFPSSGDEYGNSGFNPSDDDVSLMQEDVKIVFGPSDNELPPNSVVGYSDLITVVNDEDESTQAFDIEFEVIDTPADTNLEFEGEDVYTVSGLGGNGDGATENVNVDVDTGEESESLGTLEITITEA